MFRNLLSVMIGGAVGSALRYLTSLCCQSIRWLALPWGTLIVNLTGCFLLGLLTGAGIRYTSFPKEIYLMLTVVCVVVLQPFLLFQQISFHYRAAAFGLLLFTSLLASFVVFFFSMQVKAYFAN